MATITLGTTSVQVLSSNLKRKFLLIIQQSKGTVYIDFGTVATTTTGIPLIGQGAAIMFDKDFFDSIPRDAKENYSCHIIGSAAAQSIYVMEASG